MQYAEGDLQRLEKLWAYRIREFFMNRIHSTQMDAEDIFSHDNLIRFTLLQLNSKMQTA